MGKNEIVICLDPGHGKGINKSPLDKSFAEGDNNFYYALKLKSELEKYNCKVILTRNDITENPTLQERADIAMHNNAVTLISIHSNAFSDSRAHGITGFYSVTAPATKRLCENITKAVNTEFIKNGNAKSYVRANIVRQQSDGKDWYGVIRRTVANGVPSAFIIEHGFHTNEDDLRCFSNDEVQKACAKSVARVIAEYYNITLKNTIAHEIKEICEYSDKCLAEHKGYSFTILNIKLKRLYERIKNEKD